MHTCYFCGQPATYKIRVRNAVNYTFLKGAMYYCDKHLVDGYRDADGDKSTGFTVVTIKVKDNAIIHGNWLDNTVMS